ncbi:MAG: hypothetical protein QXF12_01040 [Candidatus Aenigmatarchaeota archaeon]
MIITSQSKMLISNFMSYFPVSPKDVLTFIDNNALPRNIVSKYINNNNPNHLADFIDDYLRSIGSNNLKDFNKFVLKNLLDAYKYQFYAFVNCLLAHIPPNGYSMVVLYFLHALQVAKGHNNNVVLASFFTKEFYDFITSNNVKAYMFAKMLDTDFLSKYAVWIEKAAETLVMTKSVQNDKEATILARDTIYFIYFVFAQEASVLSNSLVTAYLNFRTNYTDLFLDKLEKISNSYYKGVIRRALSSMNVSDFISMTNYHPAGSMPSELGYIITSNNINDSKLFLRFLESKDKFIESLKKIYGAKDIHYSLMPIILHIVKNDYNELDIFYANNIDKNQLEDYFILRIAINKPVWVIHIAVYKPTVNKDYLFPFLYIITKINKTSRNSDIILPFTPKIDKLLSQMLQDGEFISRLKDDLLDDLVASFENWVSQAKWVSNPDLAFLAFITYYHYKKNNKPISIDIKNFDSIETSYTSSFVITLRELIKNSDLLNIIENGINNKVSYEDILYDILMYYNNTPVNLKDALKKRKSKSLKQDPSQVSNGYILQPNYVKEIVGSIMIETGTENTPKYDIDLVLEAAYEYINEKADTQVGNVDIQKIRNLRDWADIFMFSRESLYIIFTDIFENYIMPIIKHQANNKLNKAQEWFFMALIAFYIYYTTIFDLIGIVKVGEISAKPINDPRVYVVENDKITMATKRGTYWMISPNVSYKNYVNAYAIYRTYSPPVLEIEEELTGRGESKTFYFIKNTYKINHSSIKKLLNQTKNFVLDYMKNYNKRIDNKGKYSNDEIIEVIFDDFGESSIESIIDRQKNFDKIKSFLDTLTYKALCSSLSNMQGASKMNINIAIGETTVSKIILIDFYSKDHCSMKGTI